MSNEDGAASEQDEATGDDAGDTVPDAAADEAGFRSGFVAILGRPNVGKSSLVNAIVDAKIAITSATPNTTRTAVRGVLHGEGFQAVFVDTPGIHKPHSALGTRLNDTANHMVGDADLCMLVVDASRPIGAGDRFIAERLPDARVVVVNKIDKVKTEVVLSQLSRAAEVLGGKDSEYFPVSARTGAGVTALTEHLTALLPEGPRYYPDDMISDLPDPFYLAELVREQLLRAAKQELPHSIAVVVTEWDWPYICAEIIVERESQKPIVVGRGGANLKSAGIAVRRELPEGAYLDLKVRVERDWQRHPEIIERFGY